MRATLAHVEAALEGREAELHDSWQALRQQAAELQSDVELTSEMCQPDVSARVRALPPPPIPMLPHKPPLPPLTCHNKAPSPDPDKLQPEVSSQVGPPATPSPSSPHPRPL